MQMAFAFKGFDFLDLDSGLSEDELLVRRTARDFGEDGGTGLLRGDPGGVRLRGNVQRGVWAGDAGAGARRLGHAQLCECAVGAGDVPDLHVWDGGTEEPVAAGAGDG